MNEYTSKGGVARSHSDNGNLKDNGKHTFVYDYKNRLIGAFDKATGNPTAAYLYYCDNRRAKKIVYSQTSPGVVERQERFFYDGQQVVEETDDAGNTLLTWVYSPVYVDEPVQMVRSAAHPLGAGTFYLHQNARADVVAVTDSAGSVVERRLFDDFGRSFDGVSKAPVSGSAVGNVYGFQGRRLDAETGLYYFRARYYDPSTGRFVQRDPVWDPGNFGNQYSFVGASPASTRDPMGDQGGTWPKGDYSELEKRAKNTPKISGGWGSPGDRGGKPLRMSRKDREFAKGQLTAIGLIAAAVANPIVVGGGLIALGLGSIPGDARNPKAAPVSEFEKGMMSIGVPLGIALGVRQLPRPKKVSPSSTPRLKGVPRRMIPIEDVPVGKLNPLHPVPLNRPPGHIDKLAKIHKGGELDPLSVVRLPDGRLFVTDGHHRLAAIKKCGDKTAPVKITDWKDKPSLHKGWLKKKYPDVFGGLD